MPRVRILTLNTWKNEGDYHGRMTAIAALLQQVQPDVVLLQEVFRTDDGLVDTAVLLSNFFGGYHISAPARRAHRVWQGCSTLSTSGLAIFSRWQIADAEKVTLPTTPQGGERIALLADIHSPIGCLMVGNIHLSHLRGDRQGRAGQLSRILDERKWQRPATLKILAGDFNAAPDSRELETLSNSPNLLVEDCWKLAGGPKFRATHPNLRHSDGPPRCIDFIFTLRARGQAAGKWENATVHWKAHGSDIAPSDHAALSVDAVIET